MGVLTTVVVGFDDLECLSETEIATGWKCQGITFRSEGKISRIKRSMNEVPNNMSTAKLEAMPNQSQTHRAPKQICRNFLPSNYKVCCVTVRRLGIFHSGCDGFILKESLIR